MNVAEFVARLAARTHPERAAPGTPSACRWATRTPRCARWPSSTNSTRRRREQLEARAGRRRRRLSPVAVRPGSPARARPWPGRPGDAPAARRRRRRRDAQRLRRHARGDGRRHGRRHRARRCHRLGAGRRGRSGQGRDVRSGSDGAGDGRVVVGRRRRAYRRLRGVRLHRRGDRALRRRGDDRPGGGRAGRRNTEAETRVEMVAPEVTRRRRRHGTARHSPVRGAGVRHLTGGCQPPLRRPPRHVRWHLGRLARPGSVRRSCPKGCAPPGRRRRSPSSRRFPWRRIVTHRRRRGGRQRRPRLRRHRPPPHGRSRRSRAVDHRSRPCRHGASRYATPARPRRRDLRRRGGRRAHPSRSGAAPSAMDTPIPVRSRRCP